MRGDLIVIQTQSLHRLADVFAVVTFLGHCCHGNRCRSVARQLCAAAGLQGEGAAVEMDRTGARR